MLVPTVAAPGRIPTNSARGSPFSTSSPALVVCGCIGDGHSDRWWIACPHALQPCGRTQKGQLSWGRRGACIPGCPPASFLCSPSVPGEGWGLFLQKRGSVRGYTIAWRQLIDFQVWAGVYIMLPLIPTYCPLNDRCTPRSWGHSCEPTKVPPAM